jgi:hypothetical protein
MVYFTLLAYWVHCKLAMWIGNPSKMFREKCEKVAKDEKIGTKRVISSFKYLTNSYKNLLQYAYGYKAVLCLRRILFVPMVNPLNRNAGTQ